MEKGRTPSAAGRSARNAKVGAIVVLVAAVLAAPASSRLQVDGITTTRVSVRMSDFRFQLSRTKVPIGTVRFELSNRGAAPHDFKIAGRRSEKLGRHRSQTMAVRFRAAGRFPFLCTLPGHARLGMKGTLVVGKPKPKPAPSPTPAPPPTSAPPPSVGIRATEIARFDRPVFVTAPAADAGAVYVVEQRGTISVVRDGVLQQSPFLDITEKVKLDSETGLLSMAFAPDWALSGLFYVFFNTRVGNGNVNVVEYRRSPNDPGRADPDSARVLLEIEKPWENHNAGMLQFGADGYLYISVGDGDSGVLNKPGAFAQRRDDLLGSILRIDVRSEKPYAVPSSNPFVDEPGVRPEIWAFGLRNPWRFWIDPPTGDLYIADPALGGPEEVDWVAGAGRGGWNFGWPCFEGTQRFDVGAVCPDALPPVLEYLTPGKCSVIGGLVARDPRLPSLEGRYLYTDFCLGALRSFRIAEGVAVDEAPLGLTVQSPTSFGEDALGRIYVTSVEGPLYRLDPEAA